MDFLGRREGKLNADSASLYISQCAGSPRYMIFSGRHQLQVQCQSRRSTAFARASLLDVQVWIAGFVRDMPADFSSTRRFRRSAREKARWAPPAAASAFQSAVVWIVTSPTVDPVMRSTVGRPRHSQHRRSTSSCAALAIGPVMRSTCDRRLGLQLQVRFYRPLRPGSSHA